MKIMTLINMLLATVITLATSAFSASACITANLVPPKEIAKNLAKSQSDNYDRPASTLDMTSDSFRRDKEYYDWIVREFCTMTPETKYSEQQRKADQIIMNAIIEKWKQK
jgi:hypothetical protein